MPEVKRSLIVAGGALLRLPRRVGCGAAMDLLLTGDVISGKRAHEIGLVDRLTESGGAVDAALEVATAISKNAPLALIAFKEVLNAQYRWFNVDFWRNQDEISGPVFASRDAIEGSLASVEKRDPVWTGT